MKKRFFTKILALTVATVVLLGVCSPVISAATWDHDGHTHNTQSDAIKYVSLGDSMTNGYGLEGYNGHSGVEDYGDDSYANLFAEWLATEYGVEVDHSRLAMSGMRAEDLHWLLELDYNDEDAIAVTDMNDWNEELWNSTFTNGDYWTYKELCDYYFETAAYAIENGGYTFEDDQDDKRITVGEAAIVAEHYQNAVKEADIISLGLGNGNFGAFMFMGILNSLGFNGTPEKVMRYDIERAVAELEPEMQTKVLELIDTLYASVEKYLGITVDDGDDSTTMPTEALANIFVYTGVSFAINYIGAIDAILEYNPDVEIVMVGLMNALADGQDVEGLTVGALIKLVYTPLNAFIAAIPTYMQDSENSRYTDATFYYAEADYISCNVDTYGDDFYLKDANGNYVLNANGTKAANEKSVIRNRFVSDLVGTQDSYGMIWEMLSKVELIEGVRCVPVTFSEILAYEAMSDVEKAQYAAADVAKAASCAAYLAIEKAVIVAGKSAPIKVDALFSISSGLNVFDDGVMNDFASGVAANDTAAARANAAIGSITGVTADTLKQLYAIDEELFEALNADDSVNSILNLMSRCVIGNGLGGHPSSAGHYALFEAVRDAYAEGYTAQDKIADIVNSAMRFDYNPYVKDPYYLAIGQLTQTEGSYAEMFADKINAEGFSTFDNSGYRASELLAILDETYERDAYGKSQEEALREKIFEDFKAELDDEKALERINALSGSEKEKFIDGLYDEFREELIGEIEKSDIISIDFGADDFTTFAINQIGAKCLSEVSELNMVISLKAPELLDMFEMYEMDWSRFEELEGKIDREAILAKLRDAFIANGFPEVYKRSFTVSIITVQVEISPADIATYAAEVYLYSFINYLYDYIATIEAIHAINPDTEVVLVGAYSSLDGVVAEFRKISMDLTAIGQIAAYAMNAQAIAHAMTMPNTTYVGIEDARKGVENLTFEDIVKLDLDNFEFEISTDGFALPESANEYVADQLYSAINFVCYHEYDNCLDTECNLCHDTRTVSGHTFGDWTETKPATLTEAGEKQRVCSVCGEVETAEIEKLVEKNDDKPTADAESDAPDEDKQDEPSKKKNVGAIIGISIGSVAALGGGGFTVYWFAVKKKKIK